jgi:hypothetical protein
MRPYQIRALKWAVENAAFWRGALVGNPDPKPLAKFDRQVEKARSALKEVRRLSSAEDARRRARTAL